MMGLLKFMQNIKKKNIKKNKKKKMYSNLKMMRNKNKSLKIFNKEIYILFRNDYYLKKLVIYRFEK